MEWWDGVGAARIFGRDDDAVLLERAEGTRSLAAFAREGLDDEATRILCDAAAILHAPRMKPLPDLVPLGVWLRELAPMAKSRGGVLARADALAAMLLAEPRDVAVLHGDIHHDNVLDFGERGWLAIDPKRLHGERGFDYANIFTNPDMDDPSRPVATIRENFLCRLEIVTEKSGIERRRLLQWIVAWTGLSAAWIMGDGDDPAVDLRVAELALAELDR